MGQRTWLRLVAIRWGQGVGAGNDWREMTKGPYFDDGNLMRRRRNRLPRFAVARCKGFMNV